MKGGDVAPNEYITLTTTEEGGEVQSEGGGDERGRNMQVQTEKSMLVMPGQRGPAEVLYHAVSQKYCTSCSAPGRRKHVCKRQRRKRRADILLEPQEQVGGGSGEDTVHAGLGWCVIDAAC